jgi:hypothetical protein
MNQADIIRMAREAGIYHGFDSEGQWDGLTNTELFERHPHPSDKVYGEKRMVEMLAPFAALVEAAVREAIKWNSIHSCHADCQNPACVIVREAVAAEREACAKVCDDLPVPPYVSDKDAHIWDLTCVDCAAAIRARGQQ